MPPKESKPKRLKRRLFNAWVSSLISISMVLVMMGFMGFVLINASRLSDYVREKIGFTLVLHDEVNNAEINQLQKILSIGKYVKSSRYIDKETAAKELTAELGEEFTQFLGYNPLFQSVEIKLFAAYTHPDSLLFLEREFLKYPQVKEVHYQKSLVEIINRNVRKISIILLIISGLLLFIFVALINNTIRISIYSERFTINTMQMVGATNSFIRKPFMQRSFFLGIYGAFIASGLLLAGIYSFQEELKGIFSAGEIYTIAAIIGLVFLLGIFISLLSTYFAVNKFIRLKFEELFY